ncbi:hypothetical protein HDU67_008962 [Dinochytrium kinnereticum]|nr:hypothetical protein HDU67_008962 [Dinochytrium kinnereticum]
MLRREVGRAITFLKVGLPEEVLEVRTVPLKSWTSRSVHIKFVASPINPADVNQIQGTYPVKPKFSEDYGAVGGNEGIAKVVEVGSDVKGFSRGDFVVPKGSAFGTWRDVANVEEHEILKVNAEGVSTVTAGTVTVNPCTAFRMLKDFQTLKPGDVVLQNGANSAVGQAVIQIARAWGLKTVNIVRDRPDFKDLERDLKSLGADMVIPEEGLRKAEKDIISLSGKAPLLGLNCVGGKSATNVARQLGEGGTLVTYGGMSKEPVTLPTSLFIFKDIQSRGFWMTRWYANNSDEERRNMTDAILGLAREGRFREPWHQKIRWLEDEGRATEVVRDAVKRTLGGRVAKMILIPIVKKNPTSVVGFHNLPNQVHRKSIKKGFQFTIMVVGESGLGKSTLVNTLFNTALYPNKEPREPSNETPKTVEIQTISADIEENGVKLKLTVIDTPGFGDYINNEDSWKPILDNIETRYDAYLDQENRVNRKKIVDTRVHACIYFIAPTGHCLKPLDIEFMRRLHHRVNLIPIIAKSDTLTEDEIKSFKLKILEDINYHKIQIYQPPTYEADDPETIQENKDIINRIPFAIVGSDKEVEVNGKKIRGRKYPWGFIEVDNEEHCDFVKLRQMLIRTHMEELKEFTNEVLYENYRTSKLASGGPDGISSNPLAKFEEERAAHDAKMAKMEAEMKAVFQQKVAEKEAKLKQTEEELFARHREMKEQLEKQRAEMEDKKRRLAGPGTPDKSKAKPKPGFFQK